VSELLADWLALREPADAAARSVALTEALLGRLPPVAPVRVVDLGAGTGSNLRYLAPRLPGGQDWLAADLDAALLAHVQPPVADCRVVVRQQDLGTLDADLFEGRHLVTASALLDLVSVSWLEALASHCRRVNAVVLFALTYTGYSRCSPPEPEDELIRELMNRHQRRNDKGFGRAAGPDAVAAATRVFRGAGYAVRREASNWALPPAAQELQRQLMKGWADAALEIATERAATVRSWFDRRLAHLCANRSSVVVGHEDLLAWIDT
jgi:SAM-dependent methyltransferase